jgi:hypothetical protein
MVTRHGLGYATLVIVLCCVGFVVRFAGRESPPALSPAPLTAAAPAPEIVVAPPTPVAPKPARLELQIRSRVKAGKLTLFVDGKQVYATPLALEPRERGGPLKRLRRREAEERTAAIDVAAGKHTLLAHLVLAEDGRKFEQSKEIELKAGERQAVTVALAWRLIGPRVSLTLD